MLSEATLLENHTATTALTVIVADDVISSQQSARTWLEEQGHHVFCAASGSEAILLLKRHRVDVLVTEIILPNVDGLELISHLKRTQPQARVIAMSAGGRYLSAAECLRVAKGLGAHGVLEKPITRERLIEALNRVVEE